MQYQLSCKRTLTKSGVSYDQSVNINWASGNATIATGLTSLTNVLTCITNYINTGYTTSGNDISSVTTLNDNSTVLSSCSYADIMVVARKIGGTDESKADSYTTILKRQTLTATGQTWGYTSWLNAITGLTTATDTYVPVSVSVEIVA